MPRTLLKDFDGSVQIIRLQNHNLTPPHTHQYLEFVYIESGSAEHCIGETTHILQAGDYFIVDYQTAHTYFSKNNDLTVINCLFLPELIDKTLADVTSFNELAERYFFRICGRKIKAPTANQIFRDNGAIGSLFQKMVAEMEQKQEGYLEMLRYLLCQVIIETVRQVGSIRKASDITRTIMEHVEQNFDKPITLSEICRAEHYSLPYISARFKEEVGIPFTEYLQNRRVEEACRLLRETNMSVVQIAQTVGYGNIKFFNRVFKQIIKMTPRAFRKTR